MEKKINKKNTRKKERQRKRKLIRQNAYNKEIGPKTKNKIEKENFSFRNNECKTEDERIELQTENETDNGLFTGDGNCGLYQVRN